MKEQDLISFFQNDKFAKHTGVKILEAGKGFCKAELKIEPHHLNAANVIQGGAIFTLADTAFAVASNSHETLALAVNANISFLKGVSTGILTATATEVDYPKRIGAYDVLITDQTSNVIARFSGLVYRKNETIGA